MKITIHLFVCFYILLSSAFAQPVINSFSPLSGTPGTLVTISGARFSPIPANNKVYFGGVSANVVTASLTSLTVQAPVSATFRPITVTVSNKTAYSNLAFNTTFSACNQFNALSFGAMNNIATGGGHSVIADLDGDGKPDLAQAITNTVGVSRNTSSPGAISFAAQQQFPVPNIFGIATGDLDGDGLLDIATSNNTFPYNLCTISILQNTSVPGTISFAPRNDIYLGDISHNLLIADIDMDGRPDIVVTIPDFSAGQIRVYRNTSTPGNISFAPAVWFASQVMPKDLEVGDFNTDGKPEVVVAGSGGQNAQIFINGSSPGTVWFNTTKELYVPVGCTPESVALGDINGDNKLDISVANNNDPGTVSVFINTTPPSMSLSFAPRIDLPAGSRPFRVVMDDLDGDGKPDLAVTNQNSNNVSVIRNATSSVTNVVFDNHVDYQLSAPTGSLCTGDLDGDGRPDLIPSLHNISITYLRNQLLFDPCGMIDISGSDTVCLNGDTLSYHVTRNAGCAAQVIYETDPIKIKTISTSDTVIKVVFLQPGPVTLYSKVMRVCGELRDSLVINVFNPPAPLTLGPDKNICPGSSLILHAGPGFTTYTWQDGSTDSVLTVNSPGLYNVKATDHCGNIFSDTINISQQVTAINLGNDTSFCIGGSVIFDAGAGFTSYQWNTGATSRTITTSIAGQFSVVARDANQCSSKDTINVLSVYANPSINLGKDSILCSGDKIVLNAGSGFVNYMWQDGSTNSTFTTGSIGQYWVKVSDIHSCKASDTINITALYPLPQNFIVKDTSACEMEKIILQANPAFRSYLWSTGSISNQLTASAGSYWLQVTDNNKCVAKEYINVRTKNCIRAVYIPNAFTPDHNLQNDVFKASVFGTLQTFHLSVFNQWGQMIFESNDVNKGWDGRFRNVDCSPGIFVWLCEYNFPGDAEKTQKGTVTLLR